MGRQEINELRERFLGNKKQEDLARRKKALSQNKNALKFEWDAAEDTSALGVAAVSGRKQVEPRKDEFAGQSDIHDRIATLKDEEMTERDWRIFRENNDIIVKGTDVPYPIKSW